MSGYREIEGPVEGYKIVNDDMTCRGVRFAPGERIKLGNDKPLGLCENGFHFCKSPSGVWTYREKGRVFKVRAYGVLDLPVEPGADYKLVAREIELVYEVLVMGNQNTGNQNTGNQNTGYWNCGNNHTGLFGIGEAPLFFFGKQTELLREDIDWATCEDLGVLLMGDDDFDPTPFLGLPNATEKAIKTLHEAFIKARQEKK